MDILEAAKSAERCQRNWSDEEVAAEDLDKIIEVCTTVPTKQNLSIYRLVISNDKEFNKRIVEEAAYQEIDVKKYKHGIMNPQLMAPTVLIWLGNLPQTVKYNEPPHVFREDLMNAVGISSSAAALTANMLGYKTGFCKCMQADILHKMLIEEKGLELNSVNTFVCALGIGKPVEGLKHTMSWYNGQVTNVFPSFEKTINVTRL